MSGIVPVPAAEAFRIYTEWPAAWLPPEHTFIGNPRPSSWSHG